MGQFKYYSTLPLNTPAGAVKTRTTKHYSRFELKRTTLISTAQKCFNISAIIRYHIWFTNNPIIARYTNTAIPRRYSLFD